MIVFKSRKGFSVVEAVLASAVFGLLVMAMVGAWLYGEESSSLAGNRARAILLAEEGLEATRNIRDNNFSNLADGTHGISASGNQWSFLGSSDTTGVFTRQVQISAVDADRKTIVSTVTWPQNAVRDGSVSITSQLTYWQKLVLLVSAWSNPIRESGLDFDGNDDGIKIQVSGNYVYLVRNSDTNFYIIDISTPSNPVIISSLNLVGPLTNIAVSGNYAYISSQDNSREVQIVNISEPLSPSLVGSYNAAGNANMLGIYVVGATVYAVRDSSSQPELYILNVSSPNAPSLLSSLELGAIGNEIVVLGNYAYIASSDNSQELQIVDISSPAAPSLSGSLNLSGNQNALSVVGFDSTIVLGRADGLLYTIDVGNPAVPVSLGSYDAGGSVNDISLGKSNTHVFIAVSAQSAEFQVVDISAPASPVLLGSTDLAGNVPLNGVAYHETFDRAFGAGSSNSEEFTVLAPQ